MTKIEGDRENWWGKEFLDENQCSQWTIGPLSFAIERLENEWRIHYVRDNDDEDGDTVKWSYDSGIFQPIRYANTCRYILHKQTTAITVSPLLADRPVVVRPVTPIHLITGAQVVFYVSSPVWVKFCVDGEPPSLLQELAIHRPSDT